MTKYAVTGITGHFGSNALKELVKLVPATDVTGLARNTAKAEKMVPTGVTVRSGDYTNVEQLTESLKGVDKLLFVSSQPGGPVARLTQHENLVTAAKNAGIEYIAYTSFPHADIATAPLASDHKATEKFIIESDLKHSFLRNNWYLENEAASLRAAVNGQDFVYAAGEGKAGWALESEYSEAAAKVLATTDPKDVYEFAGNSRTYHDLATAIKDDFKEVSLSEADYGKALEAAGMDEATVGIIVGIQDLIRQGQLSEETSDLPDVLGHQLTDLSQAIQKIAE
ncbi:NAD(P)H-binding protein [Companilactobacillus kimchiensis]|uniref:NAD(P)-binding domain-containing protein n=1 Tax=Companilactobacillus kimchiensis TaxID=993692 RepID=A0A0R2LB91_9LACO|nr:NAD(P)H-binding protein [Companilactobacillus kimchiensis]KRN98705.1 hypothetical protein IV57_GL000890 [Companilactobacillus kimchiensis]